MEPPLLFLREAYRDGNDPGHDDTVARLFDRYMEALDGAPATARPPRTRERAVRFARTLRRRLHR